MLPSSPGRRRAKEAVMISTSTTEIKKTTAMGRSRNDAVEAIIPRILGAAEHQGRRRPGTGVNDWIVAVGGEFEITLIPRPWSLYFRVTWMGRLVITGDIRSDGRGTLMNSRVSVRTWERGLAVRRWQADLFDVFAADSDRLLRIPVSASLGDMNIFAKVLNLRATVSDCETSDNASLKADDNVVPFRPRK
jgi:hypothetical protein